MRPMSVLTLPFAAALLVAQGAPSAKPAPPAPAKKATPAKEAPKPDPKAVAEAQGARKTLEEVLLAVDAAWFGEKYKGVNAVDMQGSLNFTLTAAAVNTQVEAATQGAVKGAATKNGNASIKLKSTYFANADFKTDLSGDFGTLTWTRVGNRGYLWSKERNAYTTRVDLPPVDAPLTFMTWFRETLLDIKAVYITANTFKPALGKDEGGRGTVIFEAPTAKYDPKKREQSMADTLGFWRRGRLELTYDKGTKLPAVMVYTNEANGIRTRFDFSYGEGNRLASVSIANQSRGFEGPGFVRLGYGGDGLINAFAGELNRKDGKTSWDLSLAWAKDKKSAAIASIPPPGATKMGGDELETVLLVGLAGQVMDLQRNGWNIMAPKLASK
ncbi:MAG: hypothetical protein HY823_03395 [Acidobacteria bacterium]|nr:hypothetical protein [Acidobacteriota bacterium]